MKFAVSYPCWGSSSKTGPTARRGESRNRTRIDRPVHGGPSEMATTARAPRAGDEGRAAAGRVVGIDPGLNVTGYAVVEPSARGPFVVEAGVIRPRGEASL